MSAVPRFGLVSLDCPDPHALAAFYARLLDVPVKPDGDDEDWVDLDGVPLSFQGIPNYLPPTWPTGDRPQMLHIDFDVPDLEAGRKRALELGARLLDDSAETFTVFADPVGHPFCLVRGH